MEDPRALAHGDAGSGGCDARLEARAELCVDRTFVAVLGMIPEEALHPRLSLLCAWLRLGYTFAHYASAVLLMVAADTLVRWNACQVASLT